MFTFLLILMKKAKRHYRQIMHAYHFMLYRDCRNRKMREQFYKKLKIHEKNKG